MSPERIEELSKKVNEVIESNDLNNLAEMILNDFFINKKIIYKKIVLKISNN